MKTAAARVCATASCGTTRTTAAPVPSPPAYTNNNSTITLTHQPAQGCGGSDSRTSDTSFVDGGNNLESDPLFVLDVDPSTAPTTSGDLRLKAGSPAIDAGDNQYVTGIPTDLDGNPAHQRRHRRYGRL